MRRQKTPQKQSGKMSESSAVVENEAPSVTDVKSSEMLHTPPAVCEELPLGDASCTPSSAVTAACLVTETTPKSKTPQTRKARSRIAANFGALNSQS